MKNERLQQTMHKYKELLTDYYEQLYVDKKDNLEEMQILRKVQTSKTEARRNRNYEQPNYKQ